MKACLRDVVAAKGGVPIAVNPTATVCEAAAVMLEMGVGSVLVLDGKRLIGMLSERDVLRRTVRPALDPKHTLVGDVMTTDMRCAPPDTSIEKAMAIMTRERQRHLPVVERDLLYGVVSVGDLVKWAAEDLERDVTDLATYVCGPFARIGAAVPSWLRVARRSVLGDEA